MAPPKPYFATLPPYSDDFGQACVALTDAWYQALPKWHVYQRAKRIFALENGLPSDASPFDVSVVGRTGRQGELSQVHWNALGNFIHRIVQRVTAKIPSIKPITTNTDPRSQEDAELTQAVFEYERRKNNLPSMHRDLVHAAFVSMMGWHLVRFNPKGGGKHDAGGIPIPGPMVPMMGPDGAPMMDEMGGPMMQPGPPMMGSDGRPVLTAPTYYGELEHRIYALWDVMWNLTTRGQRRHWIIVKDYVNRFEVADANPKLADKILNLPPDHRLIQEHWRITGQQHFETDEIPVYTLYHLEREGLVPKGMKGREATFLGDGTVLVDGDSLYGDRLPAVPLSPSKMVGTVVPHSPVGDMVSPQVVLNMLASSAVTNMANGAVANYAITNAADWEVERTPEGGNVFDVEGEKAAMVQLPGAQTPPEAYKLFDYTLRFFQMLSGISDVSMGQHTAGMPAQLAALMDAKTEEFATPFQSEANTAVLQVYDLILFTYKKAMKVPRDLEVLVGESRSYLKKGFKGDDLGAVSRVQLETQGPLLDSTAGKFQFLEILRDPAVVQNPDILRTIWSFLRTGRLETFAQIPELKERLIQYENEALRRGEVPPVRDEDPHDAHIQKHFFDVLQTPESRKDARIVAAVVQHCLTHIAAATAHALEFAPKRDPLTGGPIASADGLTPAMDTLLQPPRPDTIAVLTATGQAPLFQALMSLMPAPAPLAGLPQTPGPSPNDGGGQEPAPSPEANGGPPPKGPPKLPPMPKNPTNGARAEPPPPPQTP